MSISKGIIDWFEKEDRDIPPPAPTKPSIVPSASVRLNSHSESVAKTRRVMAEVIADSTREVVDFDFDDPDYVDSGVDYGVISGTSVSSGGAPSERDGADSFEEVSSGCLYPDNEALTRRDITARSEAVAQFMEDFQTGDSL